MFSGQQDVPRSRDLSMASPAFLIPGPGMDNGSLLALPRPDQFAPVAYRYVARAHAAVPTSQRPGAAGAPPGARARRVRAHAPAGLSLVSWYIRITPAVALPAARFTRAGGGRRGRCATSADRDALVRPAGWDLSRRAADADRAHPATWAWGTYVRGGPATPVTCAGRRGGGYLGERSASPVAVAGVSTGGNASCREWYAGSWGLPPCNNPP